MVGQYRGRFAPSPSGPLHFGSLLTALGSYLQAKSQNGLWFVRIEDIDKPREQAGAVTRILDGLEAFGLNWDLDPLTQKELRPSDRNALVQTARLARYNQVFAGLDAAHLIYACQCTRKQIKASGGQYSGTCRDKGLSNLDRAIRLKAEPLPHPVFDQHFGEIPSDPDFDNEDYIIKRRDGLFAYQLVVVIDDIDQGITEVVRGADIMPLTARQVALYQQFGLTPPSYLHLPLIATKPGFKLSKQNHAEAINCRDPKPELLQALSLLGLPVSPTLKSLSVDNIILWAINNWSVKTLPQQKEIIIP